MKKLFLALSFTLLAGTAQAADQYVCKITNGGPTGWLPDVLFIGHDRKTDNVVVSDPIILHFNDKKPIKGVVDTDNKVRTTFRWKVRARSETSQHATLRYSATYQKASGKVTMAMYPSGYENKIFGDGTCKKTTK